VWDSASQSFKDKKMTIPTLECLLETVSDELRTLIEAAMAKPEHANSPLLSSGWTVAALEATFLRVRPKKRRGPIEAIIPEVDADITLEAIGYYAGGGVEFDHVDGKPDHTLVTAPGYNISIGG
jgi:hypothetical protein